MKGWSNGSAIKKLLQIQSKHLMKRESVWHSGMLNLALSGLRIKKAIFSLKADKANFKASYLRPQLSSDRCLNDNKPVSQTD